MIPEQERRAHERRKRGFEALVRANPPAPPPTQALCSFGFRTKHGLVKLIVVLATTGMAGCGLVLGDAFDVRLAGKGGGDSLDEPDGASAIVDSGGESGPSCVPGVSSARDLDCPEGSSNAGGFAAAGAGGAAGLATADSGASGGFAATGAGGAAGFAAAGAGGAAGLAATDSGASGGFAAGGGGSGGSTVHVGQGGGAGTAGTLHTCTLDESLIDDCVVE